jgi:predicted permease
MLSIYIRTTVRTLQKSPLFTFINVAGLSIGIAGGIFIFIYLKNELSFDAFHKNAQNIYRVTSVHDNSGERNAIATTPPPLAATLRSDLPEIENTTRVGRWYANFKSGTSIFEERKIYAADASFLSLFTFPLVQGAPAAALQDPSDILLTEAMAEKYFGKGWERRSILGRQLSAKAGSSEFSFTVKGVLKNLPHNSTLQFDFLVPFVFLEQFDNAKGQWGFSSYYTYVQTRPGTDANALSEKIKSHISRYRPETSTTLQVQRLRDIYLNSNFAFNSELVAVGNNTYIRIFSIAGIIILLLACINFANLSTARSIKRAKEVGLRKTIGASRLQLVFQFLSEACVLCALAVLFSFALVELLFPLFTSLYGKDIPRNYDAPFYAGVLLLYVVIVLLSGFYPAFYLSSFRPEKVLQGVVVVNKSRRFRQATILLQFSLSVAMIIAAIVIANQLRYLQTKDLGFDRSQLMYLRLKSPDVKKDYRLLKNDILQRTDIAGISAATASLVDVSNETNGIKWEGMRTDDDFLMTQMTVDADFLKTTGMRMVEGRNFSSRIARDSLSFLINETAAKRMGFRGDAVGKKLTFWGIEGTVIGVVKDFHYQPLTATIKPMVLRYRPDEWHFNLLIKTKPDKIPATIAAIESLYKKYDKESAFEYGFLDQDLDTLYKSQQGAGRIINCFAILTILISCMGLFGLAAYTAEQRTKEIGIRKVLGASVGTIVSMLSKDFLKLVLLAVVVAVPVTRYVMQGWLQDFAYRIGISWWMFAVAGVLALLIALLTTGFHALRAATSNPVKSLRTE